MSTLESETGMNPGAKKRKRNSDQLVDCASQEDTREFWERMSSDDNGTCIERGLLKAAMTYVANRFDQLQKNQDHIMYIQEEIIDRIDRMG